MAMIEFAASFIAVVLAFIAGMFCSTKRGNLHPIDRKEFDEQRWIREPPPFRIGNSVGEPPHSGSTAKKEPKTIIHIHAPWKK